MRNFFYLPFMLIAAWSNPLLAQWANPLNPTGLPRQLLKPVETAVQMEWDSQATRTYLAAVRRTQALQPWHNGFAIRLRQSDAVIQVRRRNQFPFQMDWRALLTV